MANALEKWEKYCKKKCDELRPTDIALCSDIESIAKELAEELTHAYHKLGRLYAEGKI